MPWLFRRLSFPHLVIFPFLTALFFMSLADSLMAYAFPIIVEENLQSATALGIVMALSSAAGIICDLVFPHLFRPTNWKKQLVLTIIVAVMFPLFTYLGTTWQPVLFFAIASIIWGIYYELYFFAQQNFVVRQVSRTEYSQFWGKVSLVTTCSFIVGPILAAQIIGKTFNLFWYYLLFQGVALTTIYFLSIVKTTPTEKPAEKFSMFSFFQEMRSWRVLLPRLYPAVIVGVLIKCADAVFWTVGALYGYHLFSQGITIFGVPVDKSFSWLPLILYQAPLFFASLLLIKLGIQHRKKIISEWLLLLSGLFLLGLGFVTQIEIILFLILGSGLTVALAFPLNQAVYSDLIKRAHGFQEDIVGLSQANGSIAYIISPLLAGYLVDRIGYGLTFAVFGASTVVITGLLLLVTPRKIHLPQVEINKLPS